MILSVLQQYQATEVTDPMKKYNRLFTVLIFNRNIVVSKLEKEIRFLTYFIPMELASLNCKNNIDVIVNQLFRELPKRWMFLQNTTEKRSLQISRENPYMSHMMQYRIPEPPQSLFLNVQRNARPTFKRR